MTKTCSMCGETKPIEGFAFSNKAKGTRQSRCRPCMVVLSRAWNVSHPDRIRASYLRRQEPERARRKERHKVAKQFIADYLATHPCIDCGAKDTEVLQFDHVSTEKNGYKVVTAGMIAISRIQREIAKCEVRCANCHVRRHRRERSRTEEVLQ